MRKLLLISALSLAALCGCGRGGDEDPGQPPAASANEAEELFEKARALVLAEDACAADRSTACALLARAVALGHDGAKDLLWAVGSVTVPSAGGNE